MKSSKVINFIREVIKKIPSGWLDLTTHRLDIYNEELAKTQFLNEFEKLFEVNLPSENLVEKAALENLPTAYDYIRLGHPLSCVLEWTIAILNNLNAENVISFSSNSVPILAILRTNLLENKKTRIFYTNKLPQFFDEEILKSVYGYKFDLIKVERAEEIAIANKTGENWSNIFVSHQVEMDAIDLPQVIDFYIGSYGKLGSVLVVNGQENEDYVSDIQHVRRRETIAMTPANCLIALEMLIENATYDADGFRDQQGDIEANRSTVISLIKDITGTTLKPLVASSGLSVQYAIMMGLIHEALEKHKGKDIKFIVPPNCYGGTNDQARRVAAYIANVAVVDLPVDGNNDMVQSIDRILSEIAHNDAIPYIIAEIPTNPRVEVPNLEELKRVLSKKRKTSSGKIAIDPVFILDQTFCPNVHFLGEGEILSTVRTISYASGSKFPSGGKCTAGYCVGNDKTESLLNKIEAHLNICDNEATELQYAILAKQLPSMNQRIKAAYTKTREFVNFIHEVLPTAKINFVSEELAEQGFTPSVFSLDLPTQGNSDAEKEAYKRKLNLKLINLMITEIPNESKFCVSYGQLKGCYWTIPATSTQGTTKEGDKDYIVRASLSPNLDLERHKKVFMAFVEEI